LNGVRGEMCVWRKMVDVVEEWRWAHGKVMNA